MYTIKVINNGVCYDCEKPGHYTDNSGSMSPCHDGNNRYILSQRPQVLRVHTYSMYTYIHLRNLMTISRQIEISEELHVVNASIFDTQGQYNWLSIILLIREAVINIANNNIIKNQIVR